MTTTLTNIIPTFLVVKVVAIAIRTQRRAGTTLRTRKIGIIFVTVVAPNQRA